MRLIGKVQTSYPAGIKVTDRCKVRVTCRWNVLVCLLLHSLINRGQRVCGPGLFMALTSDKRCSPDTHSSLLPLQHTSSIPGISPFKGEKRGYNITSFKRRDRPVLVAGWRESCHSLFETFPDLGFSGSQELSEEGWEHFRSWLLIWGGADWLHIAVNLSSEIPAYIQCRWAYILKASLWSQIILLKGQSLTKIQQHLDLLGDQCGGQ